MALENKLGITDSATLARTEEKLSKEKAVKLFESFGVFTEAELKSRAEIKYEAYAKAINIEAKAMLDITGKQLIPAVIAYSTELATSVLAVKEAGADASTQADLLTTVTGYLKEMKTQLAALEKAVADGAEISNVEEQAKFFRDTVKTTMDALRAPADKLEMIVDKDFWPFPSYGDLLFEV